MTDTMKSCYQQLNTFIDSYLATLNLILEERDDYELTEHAIDSFESFCEIRIEAPNYQRDYEFLIDRFTQLCHNNDPQDKIKFRYLGLRGHHALIRRTSGDELHNDIWKHMNQIIPSIVFNMERQESPCRTTTDTIAPDQIIVMTEKLTKDDLFSLADTILKDLFCRAHLNNIPACVEPLLIHLDEHNKWIPVDFPLFVFSEIMNSIKRYNNYVVIDLLLNHLEKHLEYNDPKYIKTSVMNILRQCLVFAATNKEAGSTIFSGVSRLLKCLKKSFYNGAKLAGTSTSQRQEEKFQNTVIDGIRDFAENLPDFQMMEIMYKIITSLPSSNQQYEDQTEHIRETNFRFQLLLLEIIQKIAITYQSTQHDETKSTQTTFPKQLFDPLLKLMGTSIAEIRLIILEILILLIDKRRYAHKLRKIRISKDISQLNLSIITKTTHLVDLSFMKKYGSKFLTQLYNCLLMDNNTKDIFYTIYCLMSLITFEDGDKDIIVDMIHFCVNIQTRILKTSDEDSIKLSTTTCYCIHALIAAFFNLISKSYEITTFSQYVDDVINHREQCTPYLLPPNAFHSSTRENSSKHIPKECLFSEQTILHTLKASDYDISRFKRTICYESEADVPGGENHDEIETDDSISSQLDLHNEDKQEEIPHVSIHQILNSNQNHRFIKDFHSKPLHELKFLANAKQKHVNQHIEQVLNVRYSSKDNSSNNEQLRMHKDKFHYPELFIN
ncbi:hypothetical protein I4U23_013375 [Adineta vaga]|nr:hypothetical protein I4U23_013375 [Adineta vaga]